MTEIELNAQIAALPMMQAEIRRDRGYRRVQRERAERHLLSLIDTPGYYPYRGWVSGDFNGKSLLHTGYYIKYPKNSNRQQYLKHLAAKRVRGYPHLPAKGNGYWKVFDYWWELD